MNSFFRAVLIPSGFNFLIYFAFLKYVILREISVSMANCLGFTKCTSGLGRNFPCKDVVCECADSASSAKLQKCPSFSKVFYLKNCPVSY